MISERDLAEKFSVIWKEHFPLLTPSYIKILNETQIVKINSSEIIMEEEIRHDLISEFAFNCAEKIHDIEIEIDDLFDDQEMLNKILLTTARKIWHKSELDENNLNLSTQESLESINITKNIVEFIYQLRSNTSHFKPKFKGYGLIPDLEGDLSIDDTLFEIKTVNRNFRSSDLKQLILYLALQQITGNITWKYAGLYNPRKGIYYKFNIKNMIYNISGGKSATEVFRILLDSFTRDINIDSKF